MIVTRQCDTEHNHWPFARYDSPPRKSLTPRMSNQYDNGLPSQSDWQAQFPYPSQDEGISFAQSFGQSCNNNETSPDSTRRSGRIPLEIHVKEESASPLDNGDAQQSSGSSVASRAGGTSTQADGDNTHIDHYPTNDSCSVSSESAPLGSISPASRGAELPLGQRDQRAKTTSSKDEDEDDFDEANSVDADGAHSPQTAAERTAARRKMKRFRLTHQQTRFLMSEFAKQPHPDAAHRERLSREIPGLSPRQVQVWFQNRRAKIKRLNADDRDRMIKMRAVPDDFDNVQALHSPYGAVHGLGTSMASPMNFGTQSYAEHMIRPLVLDVRRSNGADHMSSSGLTPGFGNLGFNPSGSTNNTDIMSPLSSAANGRYSYSNPALTPPLSGSSRSSNPFARPNGLDGPLGQAMRPLQPLHLRDPVTRTRSESLQSPLRTSMSWKGDTMNIVPYQGTNVSPNQPDRHRPVYQQDQMGTFDSPSYANPNQSSANGSYQGIQSPENRSRLRAVSATLPLSLDVREDFRSLNPEVQPASPSRPPRFTPSSSHYGSSSLYTTSYPTTPQTAPVDFSPPKATMPRPSLQDFSSPQMSAPVAAPSDFMQAFQSNQASRAPLTDSFSAGFGGSHETSNGQGVGMGKAECHKRKRSLTLPTGSSISFSNTTPPFPTNL